MFRNIVTGVAIAASLVAMPALAAAPILVNGMSFGHIEDQMPVDPLLASDAQTGIAQSTPHAYLVAAESALNGAVDGASLDEAEATLRRAGAHCGPTADPRHAVCRYFSVETRDEYVDAVNLKANIQLDQGLVRHVALERSWIRQ